MFCFSSFEAASTLEDLRGKSLKNRDGEKVVTITAVILRGMEIQPDKPDYLRRVRDKLKAKGIV